MSIPLLFPDACTKTRIGAYTHIRVYTIIHRSIERYMGSSPVVLSSARSSTCFYVSLFCAFLFNSYISSLHHSFYPPATLCTIFLLLFPLYTHYTCTGMSIQTHEGFMERSGERKTSLVALFINFRHISVAPQMRF